MSLADPLVAAERQIVSEHQLREQVINEEFKIWKKTVPLLYDTIHTHAMKWPLMAVQFLPKYTVSEDKNTISVNLAIGTNTSGREQDLVQVVSLDLPSTFAPDFDEFAVSSSIPIPMNGSESSFKVVHSWNHPGEVNKLQVSPDGESILTFDNQGTVHLFSSPEKPSVDFKFHDSEGYGLDWVSSTEFLSGANDSKLALWDVVKPEAPKEKILTHSAVINDISFSRPSKYLFGSVSDDFSTQIHDIRAINQSPVIKITNNHVANAISFHPSVSSLFATAGKDNVVKLYDARNVNEPIRLLFGHNDSVVGLTWDADNEPNLLHSWGLDKRVITWDLNYLGEEYTYPTSESSDSKRKTRHMEDPCLKFVHGGHTNRINDFSVHPTISNLYASVGDDTLLEVFKPKTLVEEDDQKEDDNSDEAETKE
ncbi:Histone-binding protein RBBP4 or subunit C of CAF1 complex family protein [Clavispora lusitaniae]|uniref:Histone-binding protein RBBP4-like N-terminal domain-containing protein n=2 Tax=Clavispora lusitaniae TaxID=36911 RepID=C4Y6U9_CLAL4|nr:uncharacterized protein CLUG_03883 [Clavispora lusitaniae ATCC 42720]EEQ39755.1 hypothetical protein CLUG_03883 [Clavispora lusitaniae ATCC 42720]KAF7582274.1 Histone-binding protein RBBP4 or subunit C of CAF1 complex family protein [Clavispora lusitaniae]OVF10824.1 putative histone acetyltransferase type B subunit [Clavispora lusitaniae]